MDTKAIGKLLGPRFDAVTEDGARALKELGLPRDAAILDVGTGSGNFAIYLALEGYRVLTGEPSTDQSHYAGRDWASYAEKAGVKDQIRFEAFDASRLPFESATFDAVFFFGVLHHIDEGLRGEVFQEALRVSKFGHGSRLRFHSRARRAGVVVFFEPRKEMLERIRVDDPGHPPAVNLSNYLPDSSVRQHRIEGSFMNIFIYRKAAMSPPRARNSSESTTAVKSSH